MKLVLTDREQRIISSLYKDIADERLSPDKFLHAYLKKAGSLLQDDFHAALVFPNSFTTDIQSINNNPEDFNDFYFKHMMDKDSVLNALMENPGRISYLRDQEDQQHLAEFLNECHRIRPTGDYCYIPILYHKQLIGMVGHTLPEGEDRKFGERETQLLQLILPALNAGIVSHTMQEKVRILSEYSMGNAEDKLGFLYIYEDGETEVPINGNIVLLEEIFQFKKQNRQKLLKHPVINYLVKSLKNSNSPVICWTEKYGNKTFIFRILNKSGSFRFGKELFALITIEEQKGVYSFDKFQKEYYLTPRELEISQYIIRGVRNREIAESLFISEATVKRHLSNIFEKTGSQNRTQLVLQLTGTQE